MIKALFLKVVNMSITASVVILAVIAIRQLLRKQPKIYSYMLWGIVLFRLLCPYSFSLDTSLFNFIPPANISGGQIEYVTEDIVFAPQIQQEITTETTDNAPKPEAEIAAPQENMIVMAPQTEIDVVKMLSVIWLCGAVYMILNNLISLYDIKVILKESTHIHDNVFSCRIIPTAFITGVIKPKIYLPENLNDKQKEFILLHEQTHIRRGDYIFKLIGFTAVALHWFNPLVWTAFRMAESDMEMSCDEAVIKKLGNSERAGYSQTLLNISMPKPKQPAMHLAFGEGDTKNRIINILNYKKPAFVVILIITFIMVLSVTALAFNPMGLNARKMITLSDENITDAIILQDIKYLTVNGDDIPVLMKNLKKIKLEPQLETVTNTDDGYAYIMLSTETDVLKVNFNEDFSQMWLTGENGETNADSTVYNVSNIDYTSSIFTESLNQPKNLQEVAQVIFPCYNDEHLKCGFCDGIEEFTVSFELPEGWHFKADNLITDNHISLPGMHNNNIYLVNDMNETVAVAGYNYLDPSFDSTDSIMDFLSATHGLTFNSSDLHVWPKYGETAISSYTYPNSDDINYMAIAFKKGMGTYISMRFLPEKIDWNQFESIAASIDIQTSDKADIRASNAYFWIKSDEGEDIMAETAVKTHLKKNMYISDYEIKNIQYTATIDTPAFDYPTELFSGYDYVIKADYNAKTNYSDEPLDLTSIIYLDKTDETYFNIIGSVENDMIYEPVDITSTYTEIIDRPVKIAPSVVTEKDDTMTLGTSEIASYGQSGVGIEKVEITYKDGIIINEEVHGTVTLRQPVPIIMKHGTVWNGTVIQGGTGKLIWPAGGGYISRGFVDQYPAHNGIDIAGPYGTYIFAADSGVVTKALYTNVGYGTYCIIEHGGYQTLYGHCSELLVSVGQKVQKGQIIAYMGATGNATGNNLHFEVKKGNTRYNPYDWF